MNYDTINTASKCYIKNLKDKQKWYGIDDHDLGQAEKFVESFTNYLLYLERHNIVATNTEEFKIEKKKTILK